MQCNDFPSQSVIASKAESEGWERSDRLVKKSDATLKKLSQSVNKLTSKKDFRGFINSINSQQEQDFEEGELVGDVYDFDFIQEIINDKKVGIKNLLMSSQMRRKTTTLHALCKLLASICSSPSK